MTIFWHFRFKQSTAARGNDWYLPANRNIQSLIAANIERAQHAVLRQIEERQIEASWIAGSPTIDWKQAARVASLNSRSDCNVWVISARSAARTARKRRRSASGAAWAAAQSSYVSVCSRWTLQTWSRTTKNVELAKWARNLCGSSCVCCFVILLKKKKGFK